jgi:hypothetical protein
MHTGGGWAIRCCATVGGGSCGLKSYVAVRKGTGALVEVAQPPTWLALRRDPLWPRACNGNWGTGPAFRLANRGFRV